MPGAEYKAALSDFEVKSTVYKQRLSRVYTKGNHPFLLLLVILCFVFFFPFYFEVKRIVLNWLPGQTFV